MLAGAGTESGRIEMSGEQNPPGSTPTGSWGAPPPSEPPSEAPAPTGWSSQQPATPASGEPATPPAAAAGAPAGAPPASSQAAAAIGRLDATSRQVVLAGAAVALIGLVGAIVRVWPFDWMGIVLILLGGAAAVVAFLGGPGSMPASMPVSGRGIELAAGLIAAVLGIGGVVESVFDVVDNLDEVDFWTDTAFYVVLAAAGLWLVVVSGRRWSGGVIGAVGRTRSGSRGTRLVALGVLLVILGWFLNVSISFWRWYPSAVVLALALLALIIVVLIAAREDDLRLPIPGEWIAAGLTIVAAILALDHLRAFLDLGNEVSIDPLEWLAMIVYLVGVGLMVSGAVLMAIDAQSARAAPRPPVSPEPPPA
jgi:hypothetical protein